MINCGTPSVSYMNPQNFTFCVGGVVLHGWQMRPNCTVVSNSDFMAVTSLLYEGPWISISSTWIHIRTAGLPSGPINTRPSPYLGWYTFLVRYATKLLSTGFPWNTGNLSMINHTNAAPNLPEAPGELRVPMGRVLYTYISWVPGCIKPR